MCKVGVRDVCRLIKISIFSLKPWLVLINVLEGCFTSYYFPFDLRLAVKQQDLPLAQEFFLGRDFYVAPLYLPCTIQVHGYLPFDYRDSQQRSNERLSGG
jgi:hypothetical protein